MKTTTTIHPFEARGLGIAPYKFVGLNDTAKDVNGEGNIRIGTINGFDVWSTPGSTCDYCGHAIIIQCWIVSSDGKRSKVGTDCISKVDTKLTKTVSAATRKLNKIKTARRNAQKLADLTAMLNDVDVREILSNLSHPNVWRAEKGDTMLDWASWMMKNAGMSGKIKVLKTIKSCLTK